MGEDAIIRRRLRFCGTVQGVGFRWRARQAARMTGATGWVRNNRDGSVSMELQGREAQIDRVLQALRESRYIRIEIAESKRIPVDGDERAFTVYADDWW